ncbi:hypothetical protein B296_00000302 [Ensete ventricosum]|uniref:Cytokinin dehydrogenase 1 FAD/cytokinin binding domain-containing protein n=1 Tax=Ensete ventricosum TaxID=4639 RepID=A0A427AP54_ENSVE|nr:hypothetical protein B296_00000302 [Ensete ventricosum]
MPQRPCHGDLSSSAFSLSTALWLLLCDPSDRSIHTHTMILSYYDAYTIAELCRWDDRSSVVTPHEDMFYLVAFLRSALPDSGDPTQSLEYLSRQNKKILDFCDDAGIEIKQYLPVHRSRAEWARHFGPKWGRFLLRKAQFDPKCMLATGQAILPPPPSSSSSFVFRW